MGASTALARRRPRPAPLGSELRALQRALYLKNQVRIGALVAGPSAGLLRYEATYRRTVRQVQAPSSRAELQASIARARVVLVGDYHTFHPCQRAFAELVLAPRPAGARFVIALEMFEAKDQALVDRLVAGQIDEATFLKKTEIARRWPVGALVALRPVLAAAHARGDRIIAVDAERRGPGALGVRDRLTASRVAEALAVTGADRAFVLVGEYHLAPPHLPTQLKAALRARGLEGPILRVHQNPETLWLSEEAFELVGRHEVLALEDQAYALISGSPVVCQQSFLTWIAELEDGQGSDPIRDSDAGQELVDEALSAIGRILRIPVAETQQAVEVVGPHDLGFLARLERRRIFEDRQLAAIRRHVLQSESCYLPRAGLIYLATTSLAHAAEEAAHALRHHLSGEGLDEPRSLVDAFYARVMNEAVGFLGSKLVTPQRRALDRQEMEAQLAEEGTDETTREVLALALLHLDLERGRPSAGLRRAFTLPAGKWNALTHILGYRLGDELYRALIAGRISLARARRLFFEPFEDEGAAMATYFASLSAIRGRAR